MEGLRLILWCIFFVIHNILAFVSYISTFAVIFLVKPFDLKLYWKLEGFMYQQINRLNAFWLWGGGFTIHESGDDVRPLADSCCLLISNHQNTCDVANMLAWLTTKSGVMNRVMWVIDAMFKMSHFGIISNCHRDFFIQSGRPARDRSLKEFQSHLRKYYCPPLDRKWILLYPEGGFLYKQIKKNHEYAQKNDLPIFNHVGLPRIGAVAEVMRTVGRKIEYIIDVTMAYDEETNLNFLRVFIPTRSFGVSVHTRVFAASELPKDEEGQLKWMIDRWREKEKRMLHFIQHKAFPILPEDEEGRPLNISSIHRPKRVELMTPSSFFMLMFFTIIPATVSVCVLFPILRAVYFSVLYVLMYCRVL